MVRGVEGTEAHAQVQEVELLVLAPNDESVQEWQTNAKNDQSEYTTNDAKVEVAANIIGGDEANGHVEGQQHAQKNMESLLNDHALGGLDLGANLYHYQGEDDVEDEYAGDCNGEPEQASVEDVLGVQTSAVGELLKIQQFTSATKIDISGSGRSRGVDPTNGVENSIGVVGGASNPR